jgi:hypothetical protein
MRLDEGLGARHVGPDVDVETSPERRFEVQGQPA